MKFILAVLLIFSCTQCGAADWSQADKYREVAYLTLLTTDCASTVQLARAGWKNYYESNPVLGKAPSPSRVTNVCIGAALGHLVVANYLSPEWREHFQYITIGIESGVVYHIYSIHAQVKF